jgi:hypothetical protein
VGVLSEGSHGVLRTREHWIWQADRRELLLLTGAKMQKRNTMLRGTRAAATQRAQSGVAGRHLKRTRTRRLSLVVWMR